MSAYIVTDAHIDVLIDIAKQCDSPAARRTQMSNFSWYSKERGVRVYLSDLSPTDLGRMLLAENARSVSKRYREGQDPAALVYTYRPTGRRFSAGEALQAIRGYEYQACEHDAWDDSDANAFCEALFRRVALIAIPEEGQWCWTDRTLGREAA